GGVETVWGWVRQRWRSRNVFEFLRITGTAIRSHPGSAIPVFERRPSGGLFFAVLRNRGQPRIPGTDRQTGDGQDHDSVSSVGEISHHGADRISVSDAMQLPRVHAVPAGGTGLRRRVSGFRAFA